MASQIGHGACRSVGCFTKGTKIGEGTYGSVYQAQDKESGQCVAIKRVKLGDSTFEREGMPITHLREVSILRALRQHPHIVQLLEVVVGSAVDSVYLVFEYLQHDVARLVDTMSVPFSLPEIKCLAQQLLTAVSHIHANFVMHRDLKLANLLLAEDGTLKVCDFGLARRFDGTAGGAIDPEGGAGKEGGYTPNVVTLWYRAPELLLGARQYGSAVDMWSVGCMLGELLLHRPLMPGDTELKQLHLICELLGTPRARIWPGLQTLPHASKMALPEFHYNELQTRFAKLSPSKATIDLLNGLLTYDPEVRLDSVRAQAHPFFKERPLAVRKECMRSFTTHSNSRTHAAGGPHGSKRQGEAASSLLPAAKRQSLQRMSCAHALKDEYACSSPGGLALEQRRPSAASSPHANRSVLPSQESMRIPSPSSVVVSNRRQC
mmetsp:Transcript_25450/g.58186  ORF Transcript_25450/g.58186 Transcript_25450/m.58186 type:complete len:434 (-) Transcript_25450:72-1373(-)